MALPQQADTDAELVRLWLHGRPESTRKAYERDSGRFLVFVGVPVRQIRLADVQEFADSLHGAPATRARKLAVVRSLLKFASKLGYVRSTWKRLSSCRPHKHGGSYGLQLSASELLPMSVPIGSATPTHHTRLIGVRPFTWCKRPWATGAWLRRGHIYTRDRVIRVADF